jgi:hypothetical protein
MIELAVPARQGMPWHAAIATLLSNTAGAILPLFGITLTPGHGIPGTSADGIAAAAASGTCGG